MLDPPVALGVGLAYEALRRLEPAQRPAAVTAAVAPAAVAELAQGRRELTAELVESAIELVVEGVSYQA